MQPEHGADDIEDALLGTQGVFAADSRRHARDPSRRAEIVGAGKARSAGKESGWMGRDVGRPRASKELPTRLPEAAAEVGRETAPCEQPGSPMIYEDTPFISAQSAINDAVSYMSALVLPLGHEGRDGMADEECLEQVTSLLDGAERVLFGSGVDQNEVGGEFVEGGRRPKQAGHRDNRRPSQREQKAARHGSGAPDAQCRIQADRGQVYVGGRPTVPMGIRIERVG